MDRLARMMDNTANMSRQRNQLRSTANNVNLVSTGRIQREPDHDTPRPDPQDWLLIWVLDGQGFYNTEDCHGFANPGQLLTFKAHRAHHYGSLPDDPWDIVWVHFDGEDAERWVDTLRRERDAEPIRLPFDQRLLERWLEVNDARTLGTGDGRALADALLIGLLGMIRYRCHSVGLGLGGHRHDAVTAAQRYVRDHLADAMTVDDLAEAAHVSPRHLTRLFHQAADCSPMAYVIDTRLAMARLLLVQTRLPVHAIARRVGYDDPLYFSRLFRRRLGQSPTGYRDTRVE